MRNYFPYSEDEWAKIVDDAFSSEMPAPKFSQAYQVRKQQMFSKVSRRKISLRRRVMAIAAAAFVGLAGIMFAIPAVRSASLRQGETDPNQELYIEAPVATATTASTAAGETENESEENVSDDGEFAVTETCVRFDDETVKVQLTLHNVPGYLQNSEAIYASVTGTFGGEPLQYLNTVISSVVEGEGGVNRFAFTDTAEHDETNYADSVNVITFQPEENALGETVYVAELVGQYMGTDTRVQTESEYALPLELYFECFQGNASILTCPYTLRFEVMGQPDLKETYSVGKKVGDCTIESVTVSQTATYLHITGDMAIELSDNEQTVYEQYLDIAESETHTLIYHSMMADMTEVVLNCQSAETGAAMDSITVSITPIEADPMNEYEDTAEASSEARQ